MVVKGVGAGGSADWMGPGSEVANLSGQVLMSAMVFFCLVAGHGVVLL